MGEVEVSFIRAPNFNFAALKKLVFKVFNCSFNIKVLSS